MPIPLLGDECSPALPWVLPCADGWLWVPAVLPVLVTQEMLGVTVGEFLKIPAGPPEQGG